VNYGLQSTMKDPRLGFPSENRVRRAAVKVKQRCLDEYIEYKKQHRNLVEASRRWKATKTKKAWFKYIAWVAYHTRIKDMRKLTLKEYQRQRIIKYTYPELLYRKEEKVRARQEFLEASNRMRYMEDRIFAFLRVPFEYRRQFNEEEINEFIQSQRKL
jgi:hypothetical protein